jgi:hypothetical protein
MVDRGSPAPRRESARPVGQAASALAAAQRRSRRGWPCAGSRLVRRTTATAEASPRRRAAALEAALRRPGLSDGPRAGPRGRGRQTATGRHGWAAPWRAPRLGVLAIREEPGPPARRRCPLSDGLSGAAEAIGARRLGSVRRRGGAAADGVEGSAEGAAWLWTRVARLRTLAERPAAQLGEGLACSPASPERSETSATSRPLPQAQRRARSKRLRHVRRHQAEGGRA